MVYTRKEPGEEQEEFIDYYEEIFEELAKFGEIEKLVICDNIGEHLVGNVYCKYEDEEDAQRCLQNMFGRWWNGKQLLAEYSPVTDFHESCCRQYETNRCGRGDLCNFIHVKPIPRQLERELLKEQPHYPPPRSHKRARSRSY